MRLSEKNQERIADKILQRAAKKMDFKGSYARDQDGQTNYDDRDSDKARVSNEKELKRIWAEEVKEEGSREFFDKKLIKVHWISGYNHADKPSDLMEALGKLNSFVSKNTGRSKDEISCYGYTKDSKIDGTPDEEISIGVIVNGYTTWAGVQDVMSHMTSKATDKTREKHKSSGLHKRPRMNAGSTEVSAGVADLYSKWMSTDEESFMKRKTAYTQGGHEVIVDNWAVGGIVISSTRRWEQAVEKLQNDISGVEKTDWQKVSAMKKQVAAAAEKFNKLKASIEGAGHKIYGPDLEPFDMPNPYSVKAEDFKSGWEMLQDDSGTYDIVTINRSSPRGDVTNSLTVEGKTFQDVTLQGLRGNHPHLIFKNCIFKYGFSLQGCDGYKIAFISCKFSTLGMIDCDIFLNMQDCVINNLFIVRDTKLEDSKFYNMDFTQSVFSPSYSDFWDMIAMSWRRMDSSIEFKSCKFPEGKLSQRARENAFGAATAEHLAAAVSSKIPPPPNAGASRDDLRKYWEKVNPELPQIPYEMLENSTMLVRRFIRETLRDARKTKGARFR